MFNYMFKNIPSQYAFGGYSVRKNVAVMTTRVNGKIVYDIFEYTYLDNYLSFYILMDDGTYKNVSEKVNVPEIKAEQLVSRHLYRGDSSDSSEYEHYDKDKVCGVFGLRNMDVLMKQADDIEKQDQKAHMSLQALLDTKKSYSGMEIMGAINKFNRLLNWEKNIMTVPAITFGPDDTFESLIGDEMDFFDFMSGKDSDTVVRELKKITDSIDGVGNVKDGIDLVIKKNPTDETNK